MSFGIAILGLFLVLIAIVIPIIMGFYSKHFGLLGNIAIIVSLIIFILGIALLMYSRLMYSRTRGRVL